jgi:hypothetical protein
MSTRAAAVVNPIPLPDPAQFLRSVRVPAQRVAPRKTGPKGAKAKPLEPVHPGVAVAQIEKFLDAFDAFAASPEARIPAPRAYADARGNVKVARAILRFLLEMIDLGRWDVPQSQRAEVEALHDRADELVDTLNWAAEAPDAVSELADQEQR